MAKALKAVDYGEDTAEPTTQADLGDNSLNALNKMAEEWSVLTGDIENLEAKLAEANKVKTDLEFKRLPDLMKELHILTFTHESGLAMELSTKVRASISKKNIGPAHEWLENNGHGMIIKRNFVISFGKEDYKWANQFEGQLKRRKKPLPLERKESVHSGTLTAFVKEMLEKGTDIPLDTFGVFKQAYVKVTPKK